MTWFMRLYDQFWAAFWDAVCYVIDRWVLRVGK